MSKGVLGMLRGFAADEQGVVTVEWVALAGAVVIGAIAVGWIVLNNLKAPASTIGTNITSCESTAAASGGSVTGCQ
jgi:Flp pilus assembly pilin Flp